MDKTSCRLIIFDLDGTLLDTLVDLANSVNYALEESGYSVHPLDSYKMFVGNGIEKLLHRAMSQGEADNTSSLLQVKDCFMSHYRQHKQDLTAPYIGIPELLNELHQKGYILAVASNKFHEATQEMCRNYFSLIPPVNVFGQREGVAPKPDPQVVFDILDLTKTSPQETLYVGDSGVDMATAQQAGVRSVGVTWGFRSEEELRECGANYIINEPNELLALL